MIAFDMVKVGADYGVVYEMINAKSLSSVIAASPEKTEEYGHLIAAALKKLHSTEFDKDALLWDIILKDYFGTNSPAEIKEIDRIIRGVFADKADKGRCRQAGGTRYKLLMDNGLFAIINSELCKTPNPSISPLTNVGERCILIKENAVHRTEMIKCQETRARATNV